MPDVVIAVLLGVLAVLWTRARPWSGRFVNGPATLGALSGAAALGGTVLLSLTIVLSARLRFLERSAGGLDRLYRLHHRLGAVSFALLALHPVLLAWRYAQVSWPRAAGLWKPAWGDPALLSGQVALWAMAFALAVTMFARVRHQVFLWLQRLLGAMFVPAALHVFRMGGDVGADPLLRGYVGVIVAGGLGALVAHTVAGRLLAPRYRYVVDAVGPLGETITEVVLRPVGRPMPFVPGQFAFLRFAHQPIGREAHPYSIASAATDGRLRFTVKHLGDYTDHIGEVGPGAEATVEGPYGRFSHRFVPGRRQVWVAGGIGVAPFLAMAEALADDPDCSVTLCYGYADDGPPAVLAELLERRDRLPNLELVLVDQHVDGLLDLDLVRRHVAQLEGAEFLLCGPPAMLHALSRQLRDARVPDSHVHFEEFEFS